MVRSSFVPSGIPANDCNARASLDVVELSCIEASAIVAETSRKFAVRSVADPPPPLAAVIATVAGPVFAWYAPRAESVSANDAVAVPI